MIVRILMNLYDFEGDGHDPHEFFNVLEDDNEKPYEFIWL